MKLNHLRSVSLSLAALIATAPAALALDANDFSSKLLKDYGTNSSDKLSLGTATVNGSDITFDGFTLTPSASGEAPVQVKSQVTFHNVAEGSDGSFTADSMTIPDSDYTYQGVDISTKNFSLTHIYLANNATPDPSQASRVFGGLSLGPVTFSQNGAPIVSIGSITVNNAFKPSQADPQLAEIDSSGTVTGISIDLSKASDPDVKAQSAALGITQLNGKVGLNGSWSLSDGHLKVSEMSMDFDNLGKLNFLVDVTGYTPAFAQTLGSAGQAMSKSDGSNQAAMGQLMAAAQKVFVNGVSIRFDDASLTNKLLDYFAKQSGASHDDFVKGMIASAGPMTSGMGLPPTVAGLAQAAIVAYLQDPKSLEIKLAPAAPVGVLDFVAAAMQPDTMISQVGLKVLVDDKEVSAAAGSDNSGAAAPSNDDSSGANAPSTNDNSGDDNSDDNSDNSDSSGN